MELGRGSPNAGSDTNHVTLEKEATKPAAANFLQERARVRTYTPRAIRDQCDDTITHRDRRTLNGSSTLTLPSVDRSWTSPVKPPRRLQRSGRASQPKAGEPNFSPANLLPASGAGAPAGGETICRRRTEACLLPSTVSSS